VYSVVASLGLIAIAVAGSSLRAITHSTTEASSSVSTAKVVDVFQPTLVDSYQVPRSYTGMIVARRKSDLGFELPGQIVQVSFDVGDEVNARAPLATLDVLHLKTKREELVARQEQAQSVLDELIAGPREEAIAIAEAEVRKFASQVDLLEIQTARRTRLLQQNAVSREDYDVTRYSLEARKADLAAAEHKLEELTNGTRPEQIAAQDAALKQLSVQIANVDVDLEKSVLRAPFTGRIAARFVDEGKVVQAGAPVIQLIESHALEAWIGVPPQEAIRLDVGGEFTVNVEGKAYGARVSGVLPSVDRDTHTQTVILDLPRIASQAVADGQVVRLQLEAHVAEEGMWVPTTALEKSSRGLWSCYVLEKSNDTNADPETFRIARRYVELLHSDGARAFVRGTIGPGEKIVNGGTHRNVPGQLVRIGKEL
jgi:RND family efflux transporter MFP subunit